MSEQKLEQILSKLDDMGQDINELKSGQVRVEERMTSMDTRITSMDDRLNRMDENIEELKTGQKVLTDGQRGLRKEIDTRFNEAKGRFDYVDRQLRLLDVDFTRIEENVYDHSREIHRLKNL
ncbi:hypothetical protein [Natribacillus halophilus]|uniref:t-SNARE coiled-coil homology domain-containing protein n=1 Tax=Natribacillus halophilus TaxID=549003 RepID=A0A1G8NLA7_9BACI|nr:hypothetical protein [Natribacillus halophilus]SDI80955.1 hypothetical protein SAMN04488123_106137 [Natribacillus halophilus]